MQSYAQKNWKKRRRGLSNKITETVQINGEMKRVPRVRSVVPKRKAYVR